MRPGPMLVRSKCRTGWSVKMMKFTRGDGVDAFRFLIWPVVSPATSGPPPVYVTFVPVSAVTHPAPGAGAPPIAGNHVILVAVTVTPPLLQLVTFNVPMGEAMAVAVRIKLADNPRTAFFIK